MANKRNILVCGGGGFIAGHLAKDLKEQGHNVRVVDKKPLNQWYQPIEGTEQLVLDLELPSTAFMQFSRNSRSRIA